MNCEEARLAIGAEPDRTDPELERHVNGCPQCQRYRREIRALDVDIHRALSLPLSDWRQARPRPAAHTRRWAMAAGVLLALLSGLVFWSLQPRQALAKDVVAHMAHEPQSWRSTTPVPRSAVDYALRRSGVRLELADNEVVYLQSCWFRGHFVPHLVVRTTQGPITVMILKHETVSGAQHFSEGRYTGMLLPAQEGSIAVLGLGKSAIDSQAWRIREAMRSRPE